MSKRAGKALARNKSTHGLPFNSDINTVGVERVEGTRLLRVILYSPEYGRVTTLISRQGFLDLAKSVHDEAP